MNRVGDVPSQERGSAAVLAVVLSLVLSTVAVGGAVLGGVLVASRQAAAAADLAALAAAEEVRPGGGLGAPTPGASGSACARARQVSRANGARLSSCQVSGDEVAVRVTVDVDSALGISVRVPGRARAGPSRSGGGA